MITHRIVAYLISLAVGYWVLTLADKQKDLTKTIGRVIAWIIIAVSLIGPICVATSACCRHSRGGACCSAEGRWAGEGWHRNKMWAPGMMNHKWFGNGPGMMGHQGMMKGPGSIEGKGMTEEKGTKDEGEKTE